MLHDTVQPFFFQPRHYRFPDKRRCNAPDPREQKTGYKYTSGRLDNKPGGLSIPSIKKHGIVIKEVLDDAVLEELIVRNPAVGVKLPAKNLSMREEVFLTSETANEVLKAFDGHPLQALVYTTLYYGLRRSEVLGLRWNSIDFEKNTLTIILYKVASVFFI